jgi:hypothetical protein
MRLPIRLFTRRKKKPNTTKRPEPRRMQFEALESRAMFIATVDDLQLLNDTGLYGTDLVTSDPTVQGTVSGDFSDGWAAVEFDHNADGTVDATVVVAQSGDGFTYDARSTDPSLESYSGVFTLRHRAIEYDASHNVVATGEWTDFTITLQPLAPEIVLWTDGTELDDNWSSYVTFDTTFVGTPVSKSFTVQNTGDGDLGLDTWLSLPSGFSVVSPPTSPVGPGQSTSFTIQLDAGWASSFGGWVSLGNNDSDENPFDFYLYGTVAAPEPDISLWVNQEELSYVTGSVDFGIAQRDVPRTLTIIVSNEGEADLVLDPASLQLPQGFSLVVPFAATVAPCSSTSFTIQLDATATGRFQGQLSFANNDPDESPFQFTILGVVIPESPSIVDLRLLNDTGVVGDPISEDPTVTGTVVLESEVLLSPPSITTWTVMAFPTGLCLLTVRDSSRSTSHKHCRNSNMVPFDCMFAPASTAPTRWASSRVHGRNLHLRLFQPPTRRRSSPAYT